MKIMKIFLICIVAFLVLGFNITYTHQENIEELDRLNQTLFYENSLTFTISEKNFTIQDLQRILPANSALYARFELIPDIRGILFTGEYIGPNLVSGRFFSEEDFGINSRLAVVGNRVDTYRRGGQTIFEWEGVEYEVIGVIGYRFPTRFDFTVMLSLNDDLVQQPVVRYVINGQDLQKNFDFLGHEEHFGDVSVRRQDTLSVLNIIDRDNNQEMIFGLFITLLFVNSFLMIIFLMDNMTYEMKVKKANGYSKCGLIWDVHKVFFVLLFGGIAVGLFLSAAFAVYRYGDFPLILAIINFSLLFFLIGYVHILALLQLRHLSVLRLGGNS